MCWLLQKSGKSGVSGVQGIYQSEQTNLLCDSKRPRILHLLPMPAPSSSYFSPPCYKKLFASCSWIHILHSTVTTLWTKTSNTDYEWSIASLTWKEREKCDRLKFLFGINTTISFYVMLVKARHMVTLEFNREAVIHSSTDKEGKYLPTLLQSPTKVISALSPLESRVAPSLWNLSQKHCFPTQSQNKLKTVPHPDPLQQSSSWCPIASELSSAGF